MWKKGHRGESEGESPGEGLLTAYKTSLGGVNLMMLSESCVWSSALHALKLDFSAPVNNKSLVNGLMLTSLRTSMEATMQLFLSWRGL